MAFVSCIIYDLDGTLIDSAPDIAAAVNRLRSRYALEPLATDHVALFVGDGALRLVERAVLGMVEDPALKPARVLPRTAVDREELLAEFRDLYREAPVVETTLKKGVAPMLKHWQAEGTAQVVLTNKPQDITEVVLDRLYLGRIFDLVVGRGKRDDKGAELPPKPDPRVVDWILEQTGAAREETYLIGDGIADARTAAAAKIPFIALADGYTPLDALLEHVPDLDLVAAGIEKAHELLVARHDG